MKIVTAADGKETVKMSKSEWESIGKKAGWVTADNGWMNNNDSVDGNAGNESNESPLSDEDKVTPLYKAILDPTLRSNFKITPEGWSDLEEKVRRGKSISRGPVGLNN